MTGPHVRVHRFEASLFPVNAYIVELESGTVVVDATMGVTDGRRLRTQIDELGKPLLGLLLTHGHPDHYGGIAPLLEGRDVPVYSAPGVAEVTLRDDPEKELILRPMFGAEWAAVRRFPDRTVADGERITMGDAVFRLVDLGPGESPHDSIWCLEADGRLRAFVGDLVYSQMHAYLADGFHEAWLRNLGRARRELPPDTMFFMGHGKPVTGHGILDWQTRYIEHFVEALRVTIERDRLEGGALVDAVVSRMKQFLDREDLLFLLRLSIEPMRARLAGS